MGDLDLIRPQLSEEGRYTRTGQYRLESIITDVILKLEMGSKKAKVLRSYLKYAPLCVAADKC